jgi:hypothetical protein
MNFKDSRQIIWNNPELISGGLAMTSCVNWFSNGIALKQLGRLQESKTRSLIKK